MNTIPADDTLRQALARYHICVTDQAYRQLEQYCQLLWEWNQKINLTRHTDYDTFVRRDIVDSQQLAALIPEGHRVLDVGSGGGVPGLILGILRPDLQVALCDSVGKKARALAAIVGALGLDIEVLHQRAQDVLAQRVFDTLVARAIGTLEEVLPWFAPHGAAFDRLLLIKGPGWVDERARARHRGRLKGWELRRAARYRTPGRDTENVVLALWRENDRDSASPDKAETQ